MNRRLKRMNEARSFMKRIKIRFGENATLCDNISSWTIFLETKKENIFISSGETIQKAIDMGNWFK